MVTKKFLRKVASERTVLTPNYMYNARFGTDAYNCGYIAVYRLPYNETKWKLIAKFTFGRGWELYNN